jgi:hypothetical protein
MASATVPLYNFYFRYKWSDVDFAGWQTGMVDTVHGALEGGFGAAVMKGLAVTPGSGMHINVSVGIAIGPTGYLHVLGAPAVVSIATADATNPRRDFIVARPLSVDDTFITRPTLPFDSVPLKKLQETQILAIAGTAAATPAYPSIGSDDVILAAVRVAPSASSFAQTDINMHIRDIAGKYNNFQQSQARFDDRLRPFVSTNQILGIKPSQLFEADGFNRGFTYVSSSVASRFPQNGASQITDADTLVNFQSGAVTGGDAITPDFTPTIPSAGNCIVAAVSLNTNDTLNIQYGVTGTRAQCFAAVYNQTQGGGAGSIVAPTNSMPICYAMLSSKDGSNITELELLDARTPFAFIGSTQIRRYPDVILAGDGTGDYTTLASAIAALPSGGVIILGSATTVPSNATVPANTKMVGRKKHTLTISAGATVTWGDKCSIEDIIVDHSAATSGTAMTAQGNYFQANGCEFKENAAGTGVALQVNGNYASVEDVIFRGCILPSTATGVSVGNNAVDCYIAATCTFLS